MDICTLVWSRNKIIWLSAILNLQYKTDIPSDIPTLFIRLQKWAFNQGYNYVSKCSINIDIIEDLVSDLEKLNI